jgi:acetylornithine deacetylase/succinyl-diaminopimelate desuccinylase-like protein
MAESLSFPTKQILGLVLNPLFSDWILRREKNIQSAFEALLRNSVNATIVQTGDKENVIPSEISIILDGRLLPGYTPDDLGNELHPILGGEVEIQIKYFNPGPVTPDMGLFPALSDILTQSDPDGHTFPLMIPHVTDAAHFAKLGIQTYGFTPMQLADDFKFLDLMHAANERIPVEALDFGTNAVLQVLQRFGEASYQ